MKTAIAVIVAGALIGGAILFVGSSDGKASTPSIDNVSVVGGKQIVEIGVKGGYSPKLSAAKAGMPTTLRMTTNGTFDCSAGVVIPSLSYRQNLPASGSTDIEVPAQQPGTTLQGLCIMGMYHFAVQFN